MSTDCRNRTNRDSRSLGIAWGVMDRNTGNIRLATSRRDARLLARRNPSLFRAVRLEASRA